MGRIFIGILLSFSLNVYCQDKQIEESIYRDFASKGIANDQTEIILDEVANNFIAVQTCISDIVEKSLSINQKNELKRKTLGYFQSHQSIIEVTNLNLGETMQRYISDYLDRLINMPYFKVTLIWDNQFSVSELFNEGSGNYQIGAGCWQYFIVRNQEGIIVYSDRTYKRAFFSIKRLSNGWYIKINNIKAEETKKYTFKSTYR